ncbi:MAG TPA: ABC transporter ATP-binding protein [Acidobacteriota bacterium]|jgi:ATP-binding cassette subfamily B protein|nr:ABC transporter ATP-binding protein [Acidobacteriota bacterium]HNU00281.1 ABC transporter ATP-binding protein [Acidobacteriota bacterium]HPB27690.1 ABC transporter ATP-binding protein [Acidobacteriota bacterium]HQO25346.1 ABC transporter ATP-binding protein [Acidobacteriota bacterium]
MRILWRYLRPHRGLLALILLLAAIAQVLTLVDPLIFGRILDDYVLHPGGRAEAELVRGALGWLALAVAIALTARAATAAQEYLLRLVVGRAGTEMFNDGLKQTLRLSFAELEARSSGETMGLLQKVRTDTERFLDAAVTILYSATVGIGFIVWYGVTKNWLLIPVFGIGVALMAGFTGLLSHRIRTVQRTIVRESAHASGQITESLRNIELVKSLGLTWPEIRRLQVFTRRIFDLEMDKVRKIRGLAFLQGSLINLLRHSILFILLWLIFRQALSTGELVSFQLILNTIFGPLHQLGRVILSYRESEASLQAFDRLMQTPIEKRPDEPVEIGGIERLRFDDVVFRYHEAADNAIDHISFEARLGDTIAFAGPSGCGKTTLVKLLLGLYAPNGGVVSVDGIPINELRYNRVRRQIGFVAQDAQLFSGTIRENLQLVKPEATDAEMLDVLRRASAGPLLARSDQGLDTRLGEGGLRVSGGERQRLAIARALLRAPRLFIFDEATSSLDSLTEGEITGALREISHSRQHMVVLIAHRLSTIAHADTIYVLDRGRIVETGRHDELIHAGGLYAAMWRQQVFERRPPSAPPARGPSEPVS